MLEKVWYKEQLSDFVSSEVFRTWINCTETGVIKGKKQILILLSLQLAAYTSEIYLTSKRTYFGGLKRNSGV